MDTGLRSAQRTQKNRKHRGNCQSLCIIFIGARFYFGKGKWDMGIRVHLCLQPLFVRLSINMNTVSEKMGFALWRRDAPVSSRITDGNRLLRGRKRKTRVMRLHRSCQGLCLWVVQQDAYEYLSGCSFTYYYFSKGGAHVPLRCSSCIPRNNSAIRFSIAVQHLWHIEALTARSSEKLNWRRWPVNTPSYLSRLMIALPVGALLVPILALWRSLDLSDRFSRLTRWQLPTVSFAFLW